MAVTVRNSSWGGASGNTSELLVAYINEEVRVLEPQLVYARLGIQRDAPKGYDRILFPQTNQLPVKINVSIQANFSGSVWGAGSSAFTTASAAGTNSPTNDTYGVAAITEGTNPSSITWGATSYGSGPYQFGILVQVSDLLVRDSAIDTIQKCSQQVQNALARMVDDIISNVVNSGTNGVIYAGGKTTRATLGAGDTMVQADANRAYKYLASANAAGVKPYTGNYYAAVIHPMVEGDLMSNTATGSFNDVGRYTSVDDLRAGALGDFRGVRYLRSAWQNYYQSTVPVFPTTFVGDQSFGWGYFQQPQAIMVTTPDSQNALNLYNSIGGKVALGATRFEDTTSTVRIMRVESAISN